jgi:hypothetical protein
MLGLEHDKLVKRTKEEKLKGDKKSIIEDVFGTFYLNTGKKTFAFLIYM